MQPLRRAHLLLLLTLLGLCMVRETPTVWGPAKSWGGAQPALPQGCRWRLGGSGVQPV